MRELTDSIRDPWLAPRLGASAKKIWVSFRGIALGWAAHAVFGYAAHMTLGASPIRIWQQYRLFPAFPAEAGSAGAVWWFGLVAGALLVLVASAGVAKITYRELKGDDFYGASDAWRYAVEHGPSTMGTPILLALGFIGCVVAIMLAGWAGRIPWAGPVLLGIAALPVLMIGLLATFLLVAMLVSFFYAPAVIGTTGEDALEGGVQCMGLLWNHPWRTAASTFTAAVAATIGTMIFVGITMVALTTVAGVLNFAMGDGFGSLASGALAYLPPWLPVPGDVIGWLQPAGMEGIITPQVLYQPPPVGFAAVGAFLAGIGLLCLLGTVTAFAVASFVAGHTAAYIGLRRRKDGEDLLEWPDEVDELEEQFAPAPASAMPDPATPESPRPESAASESAALEPNGDSAG